MKRKPPVEKPPVTFETARKFALALPGVVEGTSYGTPGYKVGKSLFAREHQGGEALVVRIEEDHRAIRMKADPDACYITDHYRNYPWMLVRLSAISEEDLRDLLEDAWRLVAPEPSSAPKKAMGRGKKKN